MVTLSNSIDSQQGDLLIKSFAKYMIASREDGWYSADFIKKIDLFLREGKGIETLKQYIDTELYDMLSKLSKKSGGLRNEVLCDKQKLELRTIVLNLLYEDITGESNYFINENMKNIHHLRNMLHKKFGVYYAKYEDKMNPILFTQSVLYSLKHFGDKLTKNILFFKGVSFLRRIKRLKIVKQNYGDTTVSIILNNPQGYMMLDDLKSLRNLKQKLGEEKMWIIAGSPYGACAYGLDDVHLNILNYLPIRDVIEIIHKDPEEFNGRLAEIIDIHTKEKGINRGSN